MFQKNEMSAWSDENAIKAFQYGLSVPAHKIQLGQEFELIRSKYLISLLNYITPNSKLCLKTAYERCGGYAKSENNA